MIGKVIESTSLNERLHSSNKSYILQRIPKPFRFFTSYHNTQH